MIVIVMVHRCHSWMGLLVAFLLRMPAWCLLVIMEETFLSVLAQGSLGPRSQVQGDFISRNLPSTSEG